MTFLRKLIRVGLPLLSGTIFVSTQSTFAAETTPRTVQLSVTEKGFEPKSVNVKKGEPLKLIITRKTEQTCAKEIVVKDYKIQRELPLNTPVEVTFTPDKAGKLNYGCGMGMMISGVLMVE